MRKKISLSLASVAALGSIALTGCGSQSATSSTGTTPVATQSQASQQLQIFSWWTGVASSKALKSLIGVYNQQYPNVQVVNEAVAGGAGSNAKAVLASRMEAGNPPGTFQVHGGNGSLLSWIQAGDMKPLNSLYQQEGWYKEFPKSLINMLTVNGNIYAVPVDMQRANVLWYNPAIFNKYHLTPPTTFTQFFADAHVLQQHGITPLALANHGNWEATLLWSDVLLGTLGQSQYNQLLAGKGSWTSPGVVSAANTFAKMMSYTNSDYSALHWQQADQLVAEGKAAMNVQGDWAQGYFTTDLHLTPGKNFGWSPTPGTSGVFAAVTDVFGLPAKLKNEAPTLNFLKVLGSQKGQDTFNPLKGTFSPRLDANTSLYNAYSRSAMASFKKDSLALIIGQGGANPGFTNQVNNAMEIFVTNHNVNQFVSAVNSAAQSNPLS